MSLILRNRTLWALALAESVTAIGNWITMMALVGIVMFEGQGSVGESSGIMLAGLAPLLLAGPAAGRLADRFERKKLMIASQLLTALPVIGLIFLANTPWLYLLLVLHTLFAAVMLPARQAVMPQLVARENLTRANALFQQISGFIKTGAPMIGGAVVAWLGPTQAMLFDVITFGLAALILLQLPSLPPVDEESEEEASSHDQPAARSRATVWTVLWEKQELRTLFIIIFFTILVIMGFDVLSSIVVRDILQASERFFGLTIGLVGLGSVLAGLWMMMRKSQVNPWFDVGAGLFLLAALPLGIVAAALIPSVNQARWVIGASAFIGGLGDGLLIVQVFTLLQLLSPARLLGRLSGLLQSVLAAGQLIAIVATPFIVPRLLSLRDFFAVITVLLMLLALYTLTALGRQKPTPPQDPAPQGSPA